MEKITFGISWLDELVDGIKPKQINMIYGPAGVGKSTLCYIIANNYLKYENKNILYIDNDHNFSAERILQINQNPEILKRFIVVKPSNVLEFQSLIDNLNKFEDVDLIFIDSIASIYRIELYDKQLKEILGKMLSDIKKLRDFVEKNNKFLILVNQIYGENEKDIFGYENVQYIANVIFEISRNNKEIRSIKLIKHPYIKEFEKNFRITNNSFELIEEFEV
ncbi:MAG: AAA family ATPase [Candidatus Woesearchaeota archaeon]